MKVRPTLTDLQGNLLAIQEITVVRGPYTYEEWARDNGKLLKDALASSYKALAKRIDDELMEGFHLESLNQSR
ncbi:MAG: hypothetical protein ACPGYT_06810 [Nitrospirales bacterium]